MRTRAMATGILLLLTMAMAGAQESWQAAGTVVVNGTALRDVHYLTKDRTLVFPAEAVAKALGKTSSYDQASGMLTWAGRTFKAHQAVIIEGVAYVSWRDLVHAEPALEYGVAGHRAVFTCGAHAMPGKAGGVAVTDAPSAGNVVVANSANPGESLDIHKVAVHGFPTLVEFYSEF